MKTTKPCGVCGTVFSVPFRANKDPKYCSLKCGGFAKRSSSDSICKNCSKPFYKKPGAIYCSHKCQGSYYRTHGSPTTTHGLSYSKENGTWREMKKRCLNPSYKKFADYGGRGIKVCDRWLQSFQNFYTDMGPAPSIKHSIERIDNNGDYTPQNCKWASQIEQARNKRNTVYLLYKDIKKPVWQWAEEFGIPASRIRDRLRKGWTIERAIETPYTPHT